MNKSPLEGTNRRRCSLQPLLLHLSLLPLLRSPPPPQPTLLLLLLLLLLLCELGYPTDLVYCHVDCHVDRRLAIVCVRGRSTRLGRRTRPIENSSLRRWIPRRRSPRARRRRRRRATPPDIPAAAAIPPAARPARAVPPSRSTDGYAKIQQMGHDTTPIPRRSPAPPRGRTVLHATHRRGGT